MDKKLHFKNLTVVGLMYDTMAKDYYEKGILTIEDDLLIITDYNDKVFMYPMSRIIRIDYDLANSTRRP